MKHRHTDTVNLKKQTTWHRVSLKEFRIQLGRIMEFGQLQSVFTRCKCHNFGPTHNNKVIKNGWLLRNQRVFTPFEMKKKKGRKLIKTAFFNINKTWELKWASWFFRYFEAILGICARCFALCFTCSGNLLHS